MQRLGGWRADDVVGIIKWHSILRRWNFRGGVTGNQIGNSAGHLAVMIIC